MSLKSRGIKSLCMILIAMLLLPLVSITAYATETKEEKTVRVGYLIYDGYQQGEEGEAKSGSAYEYTQKIRNYTGWKYEYVYGSITDLFEMLENGEIDMMSYITYSEERAKKYLFSDEPQGYETYYIYTHKDYEEITADYNSLNGKTIGVTLNTFQDTYFKDWCKENKIDCNIVTYLATEDLHDALTNREIDALVDIHVATDEKALKPWKSIFRIGSQPLHFAISKDRPDLLEELNEAHEQILATDESYGNSLLYKYQEGINNHNVYLTAEQEAYIKNCGILKVGYLEDSNPISFTEKETGKMGGFAAEYLNEMTQVYGLEFETIAYDNEEELLKDLTSSKIDIILPVGYGHWTAEKLDITLTTPIVSMPMTVIYQADGKEVSFQKIAVLEDSLTQRGYLEINYPNSELYFVNSTKEALEAVKNGLANCYFVRSNSLDSMNRYYDIDKKYNTAGILDSMLAHMATRTEDATLVLILDKGITLITDAEKNTAIYRYGYEDAKSSLWKAIEENWGLVAGVSVSVIVALTMIIVISQLRANTVHTQKLQEEKKRADEALEKAKKAQLAKSEFLSQMSHDIRTPMNAIIGFTNMMKETEDIEEIKEKYVPKVDTASHHLLMLINDVLEMSSIESGKISFNRSVFDFRDIIESVITVMRLQAEEKDLTLELIMDIKDRYLYVDENHLNRILLNLVSNAVKFTEAGGKVTVSVVQKPEDNSGFASYSIQVSDTGIGMSPEFVEKIFVPFERENNAVTNRQQGTGLGMAIVKRISDAAGYHISVDTELGKGTTFTLDCRCQIGAKEDAQSSNGLFKEALSMEIIQKRMKGKRILLVEDNEFNSTIAEAILKTAGFIVESAEDGYIAVKKVSEAPSPHYYDLILMDIQMPVMDGYEATRAIRELPDERADVKIIAVTANAFESDRVKAEEAGMNAHVPKPLDVKLLYHVLIDVLK